MRAITLWQPWASLVADGLKTIETRTHSRFACLVGQRIAIHAGYRLDRVAADAMRTCANTRLREWTRGHYTGGKSYLPHGCIVAVTVVAAHRGVRVADAVAACLPSLYWAELGPWALVLADVLRLDRPVPCRGARGAWELPADVEAAVTAQLETAALRQAQGKRAGGSDERTT